MRAFAPLDPAEYSNYCPSLTACSATLLVTHTHTHTHTDDIDPRDLKRLRVELHHALKFIRHNRGNFDNAYNHMVYLIIIIIDTFVITDALRY